jgi:hypothetical protein
MGALVFILVLALHMVREVVAALQQSVQMEVMRLAVPEERVRLLAFQGFL